MPRVAFVTGGSRGIGEAISIALARDGVRVAVAARTASDVQRVAASIGARGGEAIPVVCDVTQPPSIVGAVTEVRRLFGPITILVNNAGADGGDRFLQHDDALWLRMIDANLNSVYYVTKAIAPMMADAGWGRIINMASVGAKLGKTYLVAYIAAKSGVLGLTRALAVELAPENITVNAICPGYVATGMTDRLIANISARSRISVDEARASLEKISPQNRLVAPEEVAALAVMLASDSARGITGQAIDVDGGLLVYAT